MTTTPLLEITIPTFNRLAQLEENLPAICKQAASLADGLVGVRVINDTSTDARVALFLQSLADDWPMLKIETNPVNLGLEHNVTRSIMTTTGTFGLVPGDDDGFVAGGLRRLVETLQALPASTGIVVLEKRRTDMRGTTYIADIPGSRPPSIGQEAQSARRYASPTDFCREVGPLSGLGLTSTVVFRSEPCRAVDPGRYLDLTVFPQVGIWLEAFADYELRFEPQALIVQRTMPSEAKLAEARGRREEKHMDPETKHTHYLGVPYAAKIMRLIDAKALTMRDVASFPELLLTSMPLVPWITRLTRAAVEEGVDFRPEVLADSISFFDHADDPWTVAELELTTAQ